MVTLDTDWREVTLLTADITDAATADRTRVLTTTLDAAIDLSDARPEPMSWYATDKLPPPAVAYLKWLVPLCLDLRLMSRPLVQYDLEGNP